MPARLYQPDQQPPNVLLQSPGWVDMGEDQPIDIGPAASAFKERFMKPKPMVAPVHSVPEAQIAPHMMQGANPIGHEAKATPKSL